MNFKEWQHLLREDTVHVQDKEDAAAIAIKKITDFRKEHFIGLYLDTRNKLIRAEVLTIGTLNSSLCHPREIFRTGVECSANSIILAHNHPSGDPLPSEEDRKVTKKLRACGEMMGMEIIDHIVIGGKGITSLKEEMWDF